VEWWWTQAKQRLTFYDMAVDGPREEIRLLVLSDVKLSAEDEREAERERTSENVLATPVMRHQEVMRHEEAMQTQTQMQLQRRPSIAASVAASVDSDGPFFEPPRQSGIAQQHRASVGGGSMPHASSVPSGLSGPHRLSFEGVSSSAATPLRSSIAHRQSVPSIFNRSPVVETEETGGDGEGPPDFASPLSRSVSKSKGRRVSLAVMQGSDSDETMQLPQPPSFAVRQPGLGPSNSRRGVRGRAGKPMQRRASFRAVNETYTPLHLAAVQGDIEQVTMLVDSGFDIETAVKDGSTALHLAAEEGMVKMVARLAFLGANITAQDADHATPMHRAAFRGQSAVVQRLVQLGADMEAWDSTRSTPLHRAAQKGHTATVKLLVNMRASKMATAKDGSTPLHQAASQGHVDTVTTLVYMGLDPTVQDVDGGQPMHHAADQVGGRSLLLYVLTLTHGAGSTCDVCREPSHRSKRNLATVWDGRVSGQLSATQP